ncbi:hypothetical protein ACJRO7_002429 [Eucalyptus globulus]|uniref:Uncharacterized protein n=1 Tax=Eucalyptus globulus TaxID=34317 RepID=A0ABD3LXR4_EUCGL
MVIVKGFEIHCNEGGGTQGERCCCRQAQSNYEAESCDRCEAKKLKLKPVAKAVKTSAKAMPRKKAVKKIAAAKVKKKPVKKPKSMKLLVKKAKKGVGAV